MKTIIHNEIGSSALRIIKFGIVIENDDPNKKTVPLHIDDVMDLGMAVEHVRENGGSVKFIDKDGVNP